MAQKPPGHSYYQIGRELTVEVYTKVQNAMVTQADDNTLILRLGSIEHCFPLLHSARLEGFSENEHKIEINLTTQHEFPVLLSTTRQIDTAAKYEKMEQDGLLDGVSEDYMDKIRAVYYNSDDKTKEAMLRSYYETKGTVISANWGEANDSLEK